MTAAPEEFAEIDSCHSLFLREISEPQENCLRLVIEEAVVLPGEITVAVGGTELSGHPVRSITGSRLFEIVWNFYVAYAVRNESYVTPDESESFSGRLARVCSKSRYLDYIALTTFASNDHPGPLQHIELVSECHIIDVISVEAPRVRQIRPMPPLQ